MAMADISDKIARASGWREHPVYRSYTCACVAGKRDFRDYRLSAELFRALAFTGLRAAVALRICSPAKLGADQDRRDGRKRAVPFVPRLHLSVRPFCSARALASTACFFAVFS